MSMADNASGLAGAFYGGFEAGDFDCSSVNMRQAHGVYALFTRGAALGELVKSFW